MKVRTAFRLNPWNKACYHLTRMLLSQLILTAAEKSEQQRNLRLLFILLEL